jgi:hypothetical protein
MLAAIAGPHEVELPGVPDTLAEIYCGPADTEMERVGLGKKV